MVKSELKYECYEAEQAPSLTPPQLGGSYKEELPVGVTEVTITTTEFEGVSFKVQLISLLN